VGKAGGVEGRVRWGGCSAMWGSSCGGRGGGAWGVDGMAAVSGVLGEGEGRLVMWGWVGEGGQEGGG